MREFLSKQVIVALDIQAILHILMYSIVNLQTTTLIIDFLYHELVAVSVFFFKVITNWTLVIVSARLGD